MPAVNHTSVNILDASIKLSENASLKTLRLQTAEGSIAFDDTGGTGTLVVAIPGMGDLRGEYRYLRPQLVAAGYRVVTLDVRGHGESSANWSDYSARATGRDVLALLKHLGREKAVLIGIRSPLALLSGQPRMHPVA